ncbi:MULTISPECIES: hypothetical protein [unclassified Caballeronia]|uniref:hypothetical protein n=1 Tax=unclassified Caballeronia TaxID=2646786 RepID=UPI00285A0BA8|nr:MULTISPECIES: hypothetical protein [unclassified Caballeronia]MDR5771016.1 hypothetical protein [Caballeronia sp. LZ002]MDR5802482.1 hypothetical protein [Caballeronia sp. LZ001]MDR5846453.1 hypothetical protein [Caballeronia sp. LZ003]
MGIGLGVVGLGLAAFTAGASIAAAGGVIAAIESASAVGLAVGTAGVVADVTAIASGAVEDSDPKASAVLGWVSLAVGICGFAGGVRQVSQRFARRSKLSYASRITLGGAMELVASEPGFYLFDDIYKNAKRLNLVAHSRFVNGELHIGEMNASASQVSRLLRCYYSLEDYNYLRLVTCNGADGGPRSFAAKLSIETFTPVKAYQGEISIMESLDPRYVHQTVNGDIARARWPGTNIVERFDFYNADAGPFAIEKEVPGYSPQYFLPRRHPTFERLLGGQKRRRRCL